MCFFPPIIYLQGSSTVCFHKPLDFTITPAITHIFHFHFSCPLRHNQQKWEMCVNLPVLNRTAQYTSTRKVRWYLTAQNDTIPAFISYHLIMNGSQTVACFHCKEQNDTHGSQRCYFCWPSAAYWQSRCLKIWHCFANSQGYGSVSPPRHLYKIDWY